MEPLVRLDPSDAPTLAMENELLRYEVIHLRARVAAAEARSTGRNGDAETPGPARASAASAAPDDTAHDDLVWLLRRLEGTPLAPVLRRRPGYRRLVETYLRDGA